jgi:hypothetical protein
VQVCIKEKRMRGHRYKRNAYGRIKNGKDFVIGCSMHVETLT